MVEVETQELEYAELDVQRLPLKDISLHPDNPRIHSPEQIKAIQESYRLDRYTAGSMCIQESRKRLYKGHAVYEALSGIGVIDADFVVKDLTDAETLALLARDNALSDMSVNDPVKLKAISVELQEMDIPNGFNARRLVGNKPSGTISQVLGGCAGTFHATERRLLTIAELKRICAFPDDFKLIGTFAEQWARMGLSVPPIMMYHIAKTIRDGILAKIMQQRKVHVC